MPHLSTLHWTMLAFVFLGLYFAFFTKVWWQSTPHYPSHKPTSSFRKMVQKKFFKT